MLNRKNVLVATALATRLRAKKALSHFASVRMVWLGRLLYAHIVYEPAAATYGQLEGAMMRIIDTDLRS